MLSMAFENVKIRVGDSFGFQEGAVKSVIDFQKRKVLEDFRYALNRQGFLSEGFFPDLIAPAGNALLETKL